MTRASCSGVLIDGVALPLWAAGRSGWGWCGGCSRCGGCTREGDDRPRRASRRPPTSTARALRAGWYGRHLDHPGCTEQRRSRGRRARGDGGRELARVRGGRQGAALHPGVVRRREPPLRPRGRGVAAACVRAATSRAPLRVVRPNRRGLRLRPPSACVSRPRRRSDCGRSTRSMRCTPTGSAGRSDAPRRRRRGGSTTRARRSCERVRLTTAGRCGRRRSDAMLRRVSRRPMRRGSVGGEHRLSPVLRERGHPQLAAGQAVPECDDPRPLTRAVAWRSSAAKRASCAAVAALAAWGAAHPLPEHVVQPDGDAARARLARCDGAAGGDDVTPAAPTSRGQVERTPEREVGR